MTLKGLALPHCAAGRDSQPSHPNCHIGFLISPMHRVSGTLPTSRYSILFEKAQGASIAIRGQRDRHCASVAPIVGCVSTIVSLPRRSVSRNVSRQLSFIAVPGDHYCKPLHIAFTATPTRPIEDETSFLLAVLIGSCSRVAPNPQWATSMGSTKE